MTVKVVRRARFGSLLLLMMRVVRADQTVSIEYTNHFGVISSGSVRVPLHVAIDVTRGDNK
jgi:hypothetical protein